MYVNSTWGTLSQANNCLMRSLRFQIRLGEKIPFPTTFLVQQHYRLPTQWSYIFSLRDWDWKMTSFHALINACLFINIGCATPTCFHASSSRLKLFQTCNRYPYIERHDTWFPHPFLGIFFSLRILYYIFFCGLNLPTSLCSFYRAWLIGYWLLSFLTSCT